MTTRIRLLLAQLSPYVGDKERNLRRLEEVVKGSGADIAVFPELYLTGYMAKDLLYRLAIDPYHSSEMGFVKRVSQETGTAVIFGAPVRSNRGFIYNAMIAVDGDRVEVYYKRHLPTFSVFDEARWFRPHRGRLRLWTIRGVGVGPAICYDMFFPEIYKAYTLLGARILVTISASPDSSLPLFHALSVARAVENTSFVVWVNTVGVYEGLGFAGGSRVVAPLGSVVAQLALRREEVRVVEIDFGEVDRARRTRPVVRDSFIEDAEALLEAYKEFEGWSGSKHW